MSEKVIGTLGQWYEERKTGKSGLLTARDMDDMSVTLVDTEEKEFKVSFSAFRTYWRKVKSPTKDTSAKERDASVKFIRNVTLDVNTDKIPYEIMEDNVLVAKVLDRGNGKFHIATLAEMYVFSDWDSIIDKDTLEYETGKADLLGATFDTIATDLETVTTLIREAAMRNSLKGVKTKLLKSEVN